MPARCWRPRSFISANTRCGKPRNIWRGPDCRCASTHESPALPTGGLRCYEIHMTNFTLQDLAALRHDTPMTLSPAEVAQVRSLNDRLDMAEVEEIYLPLSRLLSLYVAATQRLFHAQQDFLGTADAKMPYIIGVAG